MYKRQKQTHLDNKSGLTPAEQLKAIFKAVGPLYKQRDKLYSALETKLRTCNICNLSVSELDSKERKQVERYFRDYIFPVLSPQVVDLHHPFPHLPSKALNVVHVSYTHLDVYKRQDYDPGATKINQENRIKLMLANARALAKEAPEAVLETSSEEAQPVAAAR